MYKKGRGMGVVNEGVRVIANVCVCERWSDVDDLILKVCGINNEVLMIHYYHPFP